MFVKTVFGRFRQQNFYLLRVIKGGNAFSPSKLKFLRQTRNKYFLFRLIISVGQGTYVPLTVFYFFIKRFFAHSEFEQFGSGYIHNNLSSKALICSMFSLTCCS